MKGEGGIGSRERRKEVRKGERARERGKEGACDDAKQMRRLVQRAAENRGVITPRGFGTF